MALIKCPECGKDVSDKAASCPNCGHPITGVGTVLSPARTKKTTGYVVVSLAVILLIGSIFGYKFYQQRKENARLAALRDEYILNLQSISILMKGGAESSEWMCDLTRRVWYNTIYEVNDLEVNKYTKTSSGRFFHSNFALSIDSLYSDEPIAAVVDSIKDNRSSVSDLMTQVSNPSEEFDRCYSALIELYSAYDKLTSLAISPTGNLETYTSAKGEYASDFQSCYSVFIALIPGTSEDVAVFDSEVTN